MSGPLATTVSLIRCPPFHTENFRWNGKLWRGGFQIPTPSENNSRLGSVTELTPADVWAAGTCQGRCRHGHTTIVHWNGKAWSRLPNPGQSLTSAISPVSPTDAWVVGSKTLLHWDGSSWSRF